MTSRLSVVVPVYNEAETVQAVLERVRSVEVVGEIIVVDDGSTDGTGDRLRSIRDTVGFTLLRHDRNRGKGASLRTGFAAVTGEFVVIQDADLEYDPRDFPRLLEPLVRGEADVVFGSRYLGTPQAPPWHTLANRMLTFWSNLLTGLHLTDMETCYKMFRRDALNRLPLQSEGFAIEPEMTLRAARAGFRIREIPVSYRCRSYREGKKVGLADAFRTVDAILWYGILR